LKLVNFAQTLVGGRPQIRCKKRKQAGKIMGAPKNSKYIEYVRYAEHCLEMAPALTDQEYRTIQREMAAEWLKLADAIIHPLEPVKSK
jgi:hypothetical protein